ncbi:MAG: TetR family transcriptional regulator [Desulfuromonas sp.]|nr:MAG: TetR family transcriptional regulator [Desulfuromonas sp.]
MEKVPVKERILATAARLFYEQGYRATGINQIIKEAEAAKASFYQHFPSKEDLCRAYLAQRSVTAHARQKGFITTGSTPVERVCNLFDNIVHNARDNNFNGCPFLNISAEINEHESALRQEVKAHKSRLIALIRTELASYRDCNALAEMIYVIYEGANIAVKNYRDLWPVERARQLTRDLLERSA